ncbi:hypothetical protein [Haloarchaeobius sp. HRN-SO-5]|uniref:hypothetical protein n=1 Tax=Haloarchaeobius sp. HRN-SO-5 TaxID=3446118 RepID=UPI003EC08671
MGLFDRLRGLFGETEARPAAGHDDVDVDAGDPAGRGRTGVNEPGSGEKSGSHGSHWDTVVTDQDDVLQSIVDAVESGRPTGWSADDGTDVVAYRAGAAPVSTLVVADADGEIWTGYPVAEGVRHEVDVESVQPWANGAEGQVTATLGGSTVSLFLTNYGELDQPISGVHRVELAALAYDLGPAEAETLTTDDGREFSTSGMAGFVPFDGGDVDDYIFQTTVESVETVAFGDVTLYRLRAPLFRDADGTEYDVSVYAAEHVCDGYVPTAGDDVEGVFWLQGRVS